MSSKKQAKQKKKKSIKQQRPAPQVKSSTAVEPAEMESVSNPVFGEKSEHVGTWPLRQSTLLHIQHQQGNRYVGRLLNDKQKTAVPAQAAVKLRGPVQVAKEGLLERGEEREARGYSNARYDSRSILLIQRISGAAQDADFDEDSAEKVAAYQDSHGLLVDGKVGPETLGDMVPEQAGSGTHYRVIQLVTDFYNLDVTTDTLSVQYVADLADASQVTFESGNMRVIKVGAAAFVGPEDLCDAIREGLNEPAPEVEVEGPRPEILSEDEEETAVAANRAQFTDRRSRTAIQGLVGTAADTIFGPDTVQRIAEFQDTHGLDVNGVIEVNTVRAMSDELVANDNQNSAIRLVIDFFDMSEHDALLDISYDPSVTDDNAITSGPIPGPAYVRIGPPGVDQGFEGMVHTIAHELEHVRQYRAGIDDDKLMEFLGESIEIISEDMPEEGLDGLMDDARRAISKWEDMTPEDQIEHWDTFEEVRDVVRVRLATATEEEREEHQDTLDSYNDVEKPEVEAGP